VGEPIHPNIQVKWVQHIEAMNSLFNPLCLLGDYIAAVGTTGKGKGVRPYIVLLDKASGRVLKEWKGRDWAFVKDCVSVEDKLYVLASEIRTGTIYVFNRNLNSIARIELPDIEVSGSIVSDGANLYVAGKSDLADGEYLIIEKRDLSGRLVKQVKIGPSEDVDVYTAGLNPATGHLWVAGCYDVCDSFVAVFDKDLREVTRKVHSKDHEDNPGVPEGICFDSTGYAYLGCTKGIAKFNSGGELIAINIDRGKEEFAINFRPTCIGNYVYAFAEFQPGFRLALIVLDKDLNTVNKAILSEENLKWFHNLGRHAFDENTIYVAGSYAKVYGTYVYAVQVVTPKSLAPITTTMVRSGPTTARRLSMVNLEKLLSSGVDGLLTGYSCVEGYKPRTVNLPRGVAPDGFDGEWVCCLLGCGGWGCAYRCERSGEAAVFKIPRGFESVIEGSSVPTVDRKLLERVVEEANTIKALKHPNILRLYAASTNAPILIYEYADYGSLEWQLSKGWRPNLKDVLLVSIQIGDAVRYIHSRGLVHGDIKAGNIFFVKGVAKLGDFSSLTKLLATTSSHSRFAYTLGWRAPEQVYSDLRRRAKERGLEQRIDVYQLGNLILYMLAGETLDGEDAVEEGRVADAVKSVEHEELREVLIEALQPEPWSRPSIEEFVKKLLEVYASI